MTKRYSIDAATIVILSHAASLEGSHVSTLAKGILTAGDTYSDAEFNATLDKIDSIMLTLYNW